MSGLGCRAATAGHAGPGTGVWRPGESRVATQVTPRSPSKARFGPISGLDGGTLGVAREPPKSGWDWNPQERLRLPEAESLGLPGGPGACPGGGSEGLQQGHFPLWALVALLSGACAFAPALQRKGAP